MRYEIVFAPAAAKAFSNLPAYNRAAVIDIIEKHLRHEPTRISKSRIKHLRGLAQPQYRLQAGEVRVYCDVTSQTVEILAIVTKAEAATWLTEPGTSDAPSRSGGGEG
jgi:mRNA interferase RelE/StbE